MKNATSEKKYFSETYDEPYHPANRSHRAGYPFTSKLASCSHRRRALVHIDSRERIACSTRSHRELHPVGTEKCTLSGGEGKKEKALISQDFFGLVVATGLEPVVSLRSVRFATVASLRCRSRCSFAHRASASLSPLANSPQG